MAYHSCIAALSNHGGVHCGLYILPHWGHRVDVRDRGALDVPQGIELIQDEPYKVVVYDLLQPLLYPQCSGVWRPSRFQPAKVMDRTIGFNNKNKQTPTAQWRNRPDRFLRRGADAGAPR